MRIYLTLALAMLGFAAPAMAQTDAPSETKKVEFITYDGIIVTGGRVVPQTIRFEGRAAIKHDKLLELKKDFLPRLQGTARDVAFR